MPKYVKWLALLKGLLLFSPAASGQSTLQRAENIRKAYNIPAMGYAIVTADGVVEQQVTGVRKAGTTQAATLDDYFHIGSNTKAITGTVAAKLVERGQLKWNMPFFALFPEWKPASHSHYADMTLQDLLSHRAGIQPFTSGEEFLAMPAPQGTRQQQREQFSAFVLKQQPHTPKSGSFNYSNAGYTLAALMMERASGQSWEQMVTDLLKNDMGINPQFGWPNIHNPNTN